MNLFLTSNAHVVLDLLVPLLPDKPENLKLAFIPTASEFSENKSYVQEDIDKLESLGFQKFDLDIKGKTKQEIEKALRDVDVIFVAGGNTFYLLQEARKSGFDDVCRKLVEDGIWYIGSSAGSVLTAPDLKPIEFIDNPEDARDLESTRALGFVDFVLLPHWGREKYKKVYMQVMEANFLQDFKIIPLQDTQAVLVQDEMYKIVEIEDKSKLAVSTYEKIAQTYTDQYFDDLTDSSHLDRFIEKLPKKAKVLDVGSGPGQFSQYLQEKGFEVTGIDFSKEMVKIAKEKVSGVEFKQMDMRKLDFDKETFDGILAAYSLIHIQSSQLRAVLKGLAWILKPDGHICIIAQKGEPDQVVDERFKADEKMFFNFFTKDRLRSYLQKVDLEIEYLEEHKSQDPDSMSDSIIVAISRRAQ